MDVDYPEEEATISTSEPVCGKTDEHSISMYEAEVRRKYTGHRNAR